MSGGAEAERALESLAVGQVPEARQHAANLGSDGVDRPMRPTATEPA